jgi:hypothetical protein
MLCDILRHFFLIVKEISSFQIVIGEIYFKIEMCTSLQAGDVLLICKEECSGIWRYLHLIFTNHLIFHSCR